MGPTRLYVGKLNHRVTERDVRDLFEGYGHVEDILMKAGYAFVDIDDRRDADDAVYDLNGKNLFGDRVSIEFAKGSERGMGGRPLSDGGRRRGDDYDRDRRDRRRSRSRSRTRSRSRSPRRRDRDYRRDSSDMLSIRKQHARDKYGAPMRTKWQVRVENLSSRVSWQDLKDYVRPHAEVTFADAHRKEPGIAMLCFASQNDLEKASKQLDGVELNGKKIRIVDETERSRSRSRSRSRERSRSRSRSRSKSRSRSRSPKPRSRSRSGSRSG